jgi:hemolysin activation/secretion protein
VAGACITVLKFFFDGDYVIPNPVMASSDGLSLEPYTGADAGQLTVNGELNKLGHNVTFAHGIHSGIHWRSDSDTSLLLGEAVALSYLRNKARTYNEPFTVKLTKFDGTLVTITNDC